MRGLGRIGAPIARAHSYFRNAFQAFRQHSPDKIPSSTGRIRQVAAQKHVRRYRHAWKDCHRRRHRGCGRRSRRHHQKEKGLTARESVERTHPIDELRPLPHAARIGCAGQAIRPRGPFCAGEPAKLTAVKRIKEIHEPQPDGLAGIISLLLVRHEMNKWRIVPN